MGRHAVVADGPENVLKLMDQPDGFSAVMRAVNDGLYVFGLYDVEQDDVQFVVNTDMGVMRAVWPPDDGDLPFITQLRPHTPEEIAEEFFAAIKAVDEIRKSFGGEFYFFAGDQFDESWL